MKHVSRAHFFGAASAIALVGMPLMTRLVAAAEHADPADLDSLNAQLAIELAGIKAYVDGAKTGLLSPAVVTVAQGFIADHSAHRDALAAAISAGGGTPTTQPLALTYPVFGTQADVLEFALIVEQKAAATYLSIVPDLTNRALASIAASILGVETTHVSTLASALGKRVYPAHFVA